LYAASVLGSSGAAAEAAYGQYAGTATAILIRSPQSKKRLTRLRRPSAASIYSTRTTSRKGASISTGK
jgi:hypothetical protein